MRGAERFEGRKLDHCAYIALEEHRHHDEVGWCRLSKTRGYADIVGWDLGHDDPALLECALSDEAFATPATAHEIASDLVVTEAAVKQHLLRMYQKFRIPEGPNRRTRLANEVVALGLVKPMPPADLGEQLKVGVPE